MSSEPNLYASKSRGNKPFSPIKCSTTTAGPSASYKLSSKVRNILSKELKLSSHGDGCGDDASIQSSNPRRRFQRRGSKSASMFKAFSMGNLSGNLIKDACAITEEQSSNNHNDIFIQSMERIPNDSTSSYLASLGESTTTFSSDMEGSMEFGCSSNP